MTEPDRRNILVIKLSALGDFVLSIGAFQAIRRHHPDARLTLLTTEPYADLARDSGCFDKIWLDRRPRAWQALGWLGLGRRLRRAGFDRVYDLQRSDRSAWYFRLAGRPEWVGSAAGCAYRYRPPQGETLHIAEREAAQLALAGIERVEAPDLSFLDADVSRFRLAPPYALLVPGSAPHRPSKRWPAARYAELATTLIERGIAPVLIGTRSEAGTMSEIDRACPKSRDLCGETTFAEIAGLARGARLAVGNDTGPMHLAAAADCPCLVLYSSDSDPARTAPRGRRVEILREASLADLTVDRVLRALEALAAA